MYEHDRNRGLRSPRIRSNPQRKRQPIPGFQTPMASAFALPHIAFLVVIHQNGRIKSKWCANGLFGFLMIGRRHCQIMPCNDSILICINSMKNPTTAFQAE